MSSLSCPRFDMGREYYMRLQTDSVPGRAETRPAHARWLKRYLPLVEEETWAWLEIGQSDLFAAPLRKHWNLARRSL